MNAFDEMKLLTEKCDQIIKAADAADVVIDDGNVVDLIVDQLSVNSDPRFQRVSLSSIRLAISQAGYAKRFPKAIAR